MAARQQLRELAATSDRASREIKDLREKQWAELAKSEWAEARTSIASFIADRNSVLARHAPIRAVASALDPLPGVLRTQLELAAKEQDAFPDRAALRLNGTLEAIRRQLGQAELHLEIPTIEASAIEAGVALAAALADDLDAKLVRAQSDLAALDAELAQIDQSMRERTG